MRNQVREQRLQREISQAEKMFDPDEEEAGT
jgi:hypothetical protein